jgi:dolichol kinase
MRGEIHRKAIHALSLIIPIGYYVLPEESARRALLVAALVAMIIESLRLNEPHLRRMTARLVGALLREHEKTGLFASTYLILGSLLCAYSFPGSKPIVVASVLFLIMGDAAAALVGRTFGRVQIFGKTLEGSLACLVTCLIIGVLVAIHMPGLSVKAAVVGAVTATAFELLPIPLDDNFRIPLSAGFAMRLVMS